MHSELQKMSFEFHEYRKIYYCNVRLGSITYTNVRAAIIHAENANRDATNDDVGTLYLDESKGTVN